MGFSREGTCGCSKLWGLEQNLGTATSATTSFGASRQLLVPIIGAFASLQAKIITGIGVTVLVKPGCLVESMKSPPEEEKGEEEKSNNPNLKGGEQQQQQQQPLAPTPPRRVHIHVYISYVYIYIYIYVYAYMYHIHFGSKFRRNVYDSQVATKKTI
jgi:hypothetical protein